MKAHNKVELTERTRKMRPAASMNKDSLLKKRKASTSVAQVQFDQDEQTTSGPVFKRKMLEITPPTEQSHLDGRALY